MEKYLNILDWFGILCGIYATCKLFILGKDIAKNEIENFKRRIK